MEPFWQELLVAMLVLWAVWRLAAGPGALREAKEPAGCGSCKGRCRTARTRRGDDR